MQITVTPIYQILLRGSRDMWEDISPEYFQDCQRDPTITTRLTFMCDVADDIEAFPNASEQAQMTASMVFEKWYASGMKDPTEFFSLRLADFFIHGYLIGADQDK